MVPAKKVERTPYEIWHGRAPKLSYLRVWGCKALEKQDTPDKLDPRSSKCIFVGYPKEIMGYYFYYPLKNKILVARNAEFFKNSLMVPEVSESHGLLKSSGSDGGLELIQKEDTQPSKNTSEVHNEVALIESCISGKMARKPFPHQVERAKDLLGLIHTDVYGPFRTMSKEGASYFITFTDDFSRYGYVYLMKHKHEVFETFKVFQNEVENQLDRILNMVPIKKVERMHYEIWHGKAPKLSYLRVWGCEFFDNSLMVQKVSGSHGLLRLSGCDKGLELIQEEDTQPSENTSKIHNEVAPIEVEPQNVKVPICRSAKIPQARDRYDFYVDVDEYKLRDHNELPNYKAALLDAEFDK
nr:retrotransposon protein, putative, Ty1-copia subclass [Tanacetum cinerariifolium]